MQLQAAITVSRPVDEVYSVWRDFRNFPRFMSNLEAVDDLGDGISHWIARGPAGTTVEWDAEVTQDEPCQVIAWRSLDGADVSNTGSVAFTSTADDVTEITLHIDYSVPGGVLGETAIKLSGEDPEEQLQQDLLRFKEEAERGDA